MDIGRQRGHMALLPIQICAIGMEKQTHSLVEVRRCQDGRAVQGAAFRSQSSHVGVGSNPTPDTSIKNGANESCEFTFFTSF